MSAVRFRTCSIWLALCLALVLPWSGSLALLSAAPEGTDRGSLSYPVSDGQEQDENTSKGTEWAPGAKWVANRLEWRFHAIRDGSRPAYPPQATPQAALEAWWRRPAECLPHPCLYPPTAVSRRGPPTA